MTDIAIVEYLSAKYGRKILHVVPFPKPYHPIDLSRVKVIYLGCDPSNKWNYRFPYVFAHESNLNRFRPFIKSHTLNLSMIELKWEDVYAQNLCKNYFTNETSQNFSLWSKVAKDFWTDYLVEELKIFPQNIPVLMTSQYLLEVLGKKGNEKKKAPGFYKCEEDIPILPENNFLNRPLIPFYRGKSRKFMISYHLVNHEWENYKNRIIQILKTQ